MSEWVAYRIAAWDTPFWSLPNRREGRFNHAGKSATQYLSLHPLTPWAEIARNERRVERAELEELRLPVWAARLVLDKEPAEVGFDEAAEWGLEPEDLIADDRAACQALGERFRQDPDLPDALVVPSAALPGTRNLIVFGPRVISSYLLDPIDFQDAPASLVSERSMIPAGMEALIRHFDAPHRAFEAWRDGSDFVFEEPPADHLAD
ncbi:MAG TPA: RES family NAD+ phosphorylase [Solirubrobacterales bacterium]